MRKTIMIAIYLLTGLSACIGSGPDGIKKTLGLTKEKKQEELFTLQENMIQGHWLSTSLRHESDSKRLGDYATRNLMNLYHFTDSEVTTWFPVESNCPVAQTYRFEDRTRIVIEAKDNCPERHLDVIHLSGGRTFMRVAAERNVDGTLYTEEVLELRIGSDATNALKEWFAMQELHEESLPAHFASYFTPSPSTEDVATKWAELKTFSKEMTFTIKFTQAFFDELQEPLNRDEGDETQTFHLAGGRIFSLVYIEPADDDDIKLEHRSSCAISGVKDAFMGGIESTHSVREIRYYIPRSKDGYRVYTRMTEEEAKKILAGTQVTDQQLKELTQPNEDSGDNAAEFRHAIEFQLRNSRLSFICTSVAGESLMGLAEIKAAVGNYISFE